MTRLCRHWKTKQEKEREREREREREGDREEEKKKTEQLVAIMRQRLAIKLEEMKGRTSLINLEN